MAVAAAAAASYFSSASAASSSSSSAHPPLAKKAKLQHVSKQEQKQKEQQVFIDVASQNPVTLKLLGHLPDDCMHEIFSYLSLVEVVWLGRTCHYKQQLVREVREDKCRHLEVRVDRRYYRPDGLRRLVAFPLRFHIVSLDFAVAARDDNDASQHQILRLLYLEVISACAPHLQRFGLDLNDTDDPVATWSFWSSVVRTLQQECPRLTALTMHIHPPPLLQRIEPVLRPVLPLDAELDLLCGLQMLGTCKQLTHIDMFMKSAFPLLPFLACIRQLTNLHKVRLPKLPSPLALDIFRAVCTTLNCLPHVLTAVRRNSGWTEMSELTPENAAGVAVMRSCWPAALQWFLHQNMEGGGVNSVIVRALHPEELAVVTSVGLSADDEQDLEQLEQLVEQLCHCEHLTGFFISGDDISGDFFRILVPVMDKMHILVIETDDDGCPPHPSCLQTLVDLGPRNLHTLSISDADCFDPRALLRQLQALPSLTDLNVSLYRGWGVPWRSYAELRLHLPNLVNYRYQEVIDELAVDDLWSSRVSLLQ